MSKLRLGALTLLLCSTALFSMAQDKKEEEETGGFKKENLFTGGSLSLSFGNNTFLAGVNPVLGYSITKWLDAGIAVNYIYTSQRDDQSTAKFRQNLYGGGVFTRIFPVRFLFLQGQLEHNFINLKFLPGNTGASPYSETNSATSLLVGAGYTTGRFPGNSGSYGYFAVMIDALDNPYSPYRDAQNRVIPIIRAGINVPLFQGRN